MTRCTLLFIVWSLSPVFAQKTPEQILGKVDKIMQSEGLIPSEAPFPPQSTVIRVFKQEGECEIWANGESHQNMTLVATLPICAVDRQAGPKLRQGDGKTPEGFFEINFKHGFYSEMWFMWIDLDQLGKTGEPGVGSCFKTFVAYPTRLDHFHTRLADFSDPGGAIFAHGNCVTAGCISFENRNYLSVFAYARHAYLNRKNGKGVQIHIYPFRFDRVDAGKRMELARNNAVGWSPEMLLQFWENLETGFNLFNQNPHFLEVGLYSGALDLQENSPRVVALKRFLKKQGIFKGEMDAMFGADLQIAVQSFQRSHHLVPDGIAGPATLRTMKLYPPGYHLK